jgi:hypothetical protein
MISYDKLRSRLIGTVLRETYGISPRPTSITHDITDESQLQTLNSFLANVSNKNYSNPLNALSELRMRLHTLGYNFDYENEIPNESEEYELNRFGGRYGFLDDSGDVTSDDGFDVTGFILRVNFEKDLVSHMFVVSPEVVPADDE